MAVLLLSRPCLPYGRASDIWLESALLTEDRARLDVWLDCVEAQLV